MTTQITLEQVLQLASFKQYTDGTWSVEDVYGNVKGNVYGDVNGSVKGNVGGNVKGNVYGDVSGGVGGYVSGDVGNVYDTINGKEWQYVETPAEKLRRLIMNGATQDEMIQVLNKMENN